MNKFIQVKIAVPDISQLTDSQIQDVVNSISQNVANQIMTYINANRNREEMFYWNKRFLDWQIEDYNHILKFGHLYEQRPNQQRIDEMGYSSLPNNSNKTV